MHAAETCLFFLVMSAHWASKDQDQFTGNSQPSCVRADAGDRKAQKVTAATPTVAIKEQPSQAKLPSFQAFEVSTGETVKRLPPDYLVLCHPFSLKSKIPHSAPIEAMRVTGTEVAAWALMNLKKCSGCRAQVTDSDLRDSFNLLVFVNPADYKNALENVRRLQDIVELAGAHAAMYSQEEQH